MCRRGKKKGGLLLARSLGGSGRSRALFKLTPHSPGVPPPRPGAHTHTGTRTHTPRHPCHPLMATPLPAPLPRGPAPDGHAIADWSDDEEGGAPGAPTGAAAAALSLGDPSEPAGPGMTSMSGTGPGGLWALQVTQYPGFLCRVVSRVRVLWRRTKKWGTSLEGGKRASARGGQKPRGGALVPAPAGRAPPARAADSGIRPALCGAGSPGHALVGGEEATGRDRGGLWGRWRGRERGSGGGGQAPRAVSVAEGPSEPREWAWPGAAAAPLRLGRPDKGVA